MKKLIAPIIITALLVLYYIFFFMIILIIPEIPLLVRLLGGLIPLALAGVAIFVLCERYKEIRSGEEDDLSKY